MTSTDSNSFSRTVYRRDLVARFDAIVMERVDVEVLSERAWPIFLIKKECSGPRLGGPT